MILQARKENENKVAEEDEGAREAGEENHEKNHEKNRRKKNEKGREKVESLDSGVLNCVSTKNLQQCT